MCREALLRPGRMYDINQRYYLKNLPSGHSAPPPLACACPASSARLGRLGERTSDIIVTTCHPAINGCMISP